MLLAFHPAPLAPLGLPVDPLSNVLSLLKPRSYMSGGFDAGGEWSVRFPQHEGVKCYAVVSGQCWLSVEGVPDAVSLSLGYESESAFSTVQPSRGSWAVRHGNIAVAGIRLLLHTAREKPPAPISSNLS
jgi:Cupin